VRAVVDTNIVFSALHRGGKPGEVIRRWRAGEFTLCLSDEIVKEYKKTLARPEFEKELAELKRLINLRRHCDFYAFPPPLKIVVKDPTDDKFLECAAALKAQFVVTGDRALLKSGKDRRLRERGIAVVNSGDFLALL
jgi:putative PIN family toxin of toxin-antitoxin system